MVSLLGSSSPKEPSSPFSLFQKKSQTKKREKEGKGTPDLGARSHALHHLRSDHTLSSSQDLIFSLISEWGRKVANLHSNDSGSSGIIFCSQIKELTPSVIEKSLSERCTSLSTAFEKEEMSWMSCCQSIEELFYSTLAFKQLITQSSSSSHTPNDFSSTLDQIKETIYKLENMAVREAPDLSYSQLLKYCLLFREHYAKSRHKSEFIRLEPEESKLPFPVTIDPEHKRFFIHIKKRLPESDLSIWEGKKIYGTLMVTDNKRRIEIIKEVTLDWLAYNPKEIAFLKQFSFSPFIGNPPIAIIDFQERDEFITERLIDKVALIYRPILGNFREYGETISENSRLETFIPLLCDVARGLEALHSAGYVHGGISLETLFVLQEEKGEQMEAKGIIGELDDLHKIKQIKKLSRGRSVSSGKFFNGMHEPFNESVTDISLRTTYSGSDSQSSLVESFSVKDDTWAFGITAWQCLYGKKPKDSCDDGQLAKMTESQAYALLQTKFPYPRSERENAMQKAIWQCLNVNSKERIDSTMLVHLLEKQVSRRVSSSSILRKTSHQIFHGGVHSLATRSMPPELFDLFSTEGELHIQIDHIEKLIIGMQPPYSAQLSEIMECEKKIHNVYHLLEKQEKKIAHFHSDYAEALRPYKENSSNFEHSLQNIKKKISSILLKGGGGLVYGEFSEYSAFGKAYFKQTKESFRFSREGIQIQPRAYHLPKGGERGYRHALTLDPAAKNIFVHLKKKGTRNDALGKGAEKSVHEALIIHEDSFELVADIVLRVKGEGFKNKEERLKQLFADCPYKEDWQKQIFADSLYTDEKLKLIFADCPFIENPSLAITTYIKEEIPGFWHQKLDLTDEEIIKMKENEEKKPVEKIAFLAHKYFYSLSQLSYELKEKRNIPLLITLLRDVMRGLANMHAKGFIHRDLKSGNIFVDKVGQSEEPYYIGVIGDLGEVAYIGERGIVPEGVSMAGTLLYNSPEICKDKTDPSYRKQSFASDIWAFGIMACQTLYGNSGIDIPFLDSGHDHILYKIMMLEQAHVDNAIKARFPPPESHAERCMQEIILQCLKVDPDSRPSAQSLASREF